MTSNSQPSAQDTRSAKLRTWGWMMFDWASQPFHTLLITFIFAPYFAEVVAAQLMREGMLPEAAKAAAQAKWGYGLAAAGVLVALLAPALGAIADGKSRRLPWIYGFSALYVVGCAGIWVAVPDSMDTTRVLVFFGIGLIGMEFATIFTNAMLPDLGPRDDIGKVSGSGWAWGYVGGLVALIFTLLFMADNADGVTFIGRAPVFGLDGAAREGSRAIGPFTSIWYMIFMLPFFLWVREVPRTTPEVGVMKSLRGLKGTIVSVARNRSLGAYLASSMFYRDALNGVYTFGGIYALGVLGWSVPDVGVFGILALISGALFAWLGGRWDAAAGPMPVIKLSIWALFGVTLGIVFVSRESIFGIAVSPDSNLPDITFYICGAIIGAAGGAMQAASRTMMVRQANPKRMTEAFGLYALSGKATSFLAPALIALATDISGSQRLGVTPLILLFLVGIVLLHWVKPEGDAAAWAEQDAKSNA